VTTQAETRPAVDLDRLAVDTVRVLAMDAIQKAGSGHPGTAMALAPAAYVLWTGFLTFEPAEPEWPDRDGSCSPTGTPRCCSTRCCT
jgi:transketolase